MEVFIAQIINGLSLGSIYVLLVTGFNLLLLVAMIIHFSYPQMVVFSMYVTWGMLNITGGNIVVGFVVGVAASIILNVATAPLFQRVMKNRGSVDINATMVLSMAIGMILVELMSHSFNHGHPVAFPEKMSGAAALISIGLIHVSYGQIYALGIGVVAVAMFFWMLYKTKMGRAFRAIAEDPAGAKLVGIPILKTGLGSYALTGFLGGITEKLLSVLLGTASPSLGEQVAHKVLAVSIIAGLGNLKGGLVIGLLLGILEALVQGYMSGSWSNAIAFVVMLVVILAKPKGVFGIKL